MTDVVHAASDVVCAWLLQTTLGALAVIACVAVAERLLRSHLSATWRHVLWCLVVVRLLLPIAPPSPLSVLNLLSPHVTTDSAAAQPASGPTTERGPASATVALPRLDASAGPRATPPSALPTPGLDALPPVGSAPAPTPAARAAVQPAATPRHWQTLVALVWLAGAGLAFAWTCLRELRFRTALRREPELRDPRVLALLADVCRTADVRRAPRVVATDLVESPALAGVLRPAVLLPRAAAADLDDDALRHVLRHEVAHLRAGDVLGNWVLALLAAVHWFDPFVRIAFARLRAVREELRDATALAGCEPAERAAYGRTLLRLLEQGTGVAAARRGPSVATAGIVERRRDLRRRIEMIASGGHGGRRAWLLGVCAAGVISALALTGSTTRPAQAQETSGGAAADPGGERGASGMPILRTSTSASISHATFWKTIRVEGRRDVPAWETEIRAKLARPVAVGSASMTLAALLELEREGTGVSFVLGPDERAACSGETVTLPEGTSGSAERLLRTALRQLDLGWCVADGAVYIRQTYALPVSYERRFYDIEPLLVRGNSVDALIELTRQYVDPEAWELHRASIGGWKGLLVVDQSADVHAAVERFLNSLLNRGNAPAPDAESWRAELAARLAEPVSVKYEDAALADALAQFRTATGVGVVIAAEDVEDVHVSLALDGVPRGHALTWIARLAGLHVRMEDGVVVLARRPQLEVRCYDVADIVAARAGDDDGGGIEAVCDLVVSAVDPPSWEEWCSVSPWEGLLVVRQTPANHTRIESELTTLRRALGR